MRECHAQCVRIERSGSPIFSDSKEYIQYIPWTKIVSIHRDWRIAFRREPVHAQAWCPLPVGNAVSEEISNCTGKLGGTSAHV